MSGAHPEEQTAELLADLVDARLDLREALVELEAMREALTLVTADARRIAAERSEATRMVSVLTNDLRDARRRLKKYTRS